MANRLQQEKLAEISGILSVVTSKMVVPLFFSFWILDLIYAPQYKWEFLGLRGLVVPFAFITHLLLKRVKTYRAAEYLALLYAFLLASIINTMIFIIGPNSSYFYGLTLVAVGGLSFIPWSGPRFAMAVSAIYGPYFVFQLLAIDTLQQYREFAVHAFITFGIVAITAVIKIYRERLRREELLIRNKLESEIEKRKDTEQELIMARDEALAATRAKESFLANMSHEIRTPLTAIIGYAETSLDGEQARDELVSSLRTIRRSGDHLLNIINDILDFSKIEAGALDVEKIRMSPLQMVAEVESILSSIAGKKDIEFRVAYKFPLPEYIQGDPVRLKQILLNLCGNSIKFTDNGKVKLTLEYSNEDQPGTMSFAVKDTGIGMTEEQLEHIFKPFKQADSSTTRKYGGTGLGLSLSNQLAELMGGKLSVASQPGRGSIFTLSIPVGARQDIKLINSSDEVQLDTNQEHADKSMQALSGTILLAEDNKVNQKLISVYLQRMGAEVTIANNGLEALHLTEKQDFDLIFMDMQMPVMSGLESVAQLRANGNTTPIVALTANVTQDDRERCKQAGYTDFATKPIIRKQLYSITARYLSVAPQKDKNVIPLTSELLLEAPELQEAVIEFIEALPGMVLEIFNAFECKDWDTFKDAVHVLKGAGGSYGYPLLTELTEKMEDNLDDNQLLIKLLNELGEVCQQVYEGTPQHKAVM